MPAAAAQMSKICLHDVARADRRDGQAMNVKKYVCSVAPLVSEYLVVS